MNNADTDPSALEFAYESLRRRDWMAVLNFIHAGDTLPTDDAALERFVCTFKEEFFRTLPEDVDEHPGRGFVVSSSRAELRSGRADGFSPSRADISERVLLFFVAGRLALSREQTRLLVVRLLSYHRENPEKALDIARLFPDEPESQALLRQFAPPEKRSSASVRETGVHVTEHATSMEVDARQRLFRSAQEERLYAAICGRFPGALAVPNAALHAFLDYDRVRSRLTSAERDYFFHALVDCVLFDPDDAFRAVACFELDSPLHDDDRQISRDAMKDRILAVAGVKLYRVRPGRSGVDEKTFSSVLETIHVGRRRGA